MAFKIISGLDETCQVLYNGLQDAHKIGSETQCKRGAHRILMERNDKPRKGLSTPCKQNGKHTHLTNSFCIRSASHDASASIYIRITEGRGALELLGTSVAIMTEPIAKAKERQRKAKNQADGEVPNSVQNASSLKGKTTFKKRFVTCSGIQKPLEIWLFISNYPQQCLQHKAKINRGKISTYLASKTPTYSSSQSKTSKHKGC